VQQVEAIVAPYIGTEIERANPRVPGNFGASEEMNTGRFSIFLQGRGASAAPDRRGGRQLQKELHTMPA
jgi:multidrug efflux pump